MEDEVALPWSWREECRGVGSVALRFCSICDLAIVSCTASRFDVGTDAGFHAEEIFLLLQRKSINTVLDVPQSPVNRNFYFLPFISVVGERLLGRFWEYEC